MNILLKEILAVQNWEKQYNHYARKNLLNSLNFKLVNQENFENFQNFIQAIVEKSPRKSKKRWVSNERRILHILLNCISVIHHQTVHEFKTFEIQRICRVFPYKDKYSIEYEIRKLETNNKQNRRRWSQKQENFLQDIVKKTPNKNKWNEIARELFIKSKGEYFRQGKHCRQRFFKLKDSKGQCSLSESISNDLQNQKQNSLQFHGLDSMKSSEKNLIKEEVLESMENEKFQKNNLINQVDQIQKNKKSSIDTKILLSSNIKALNNPKNKRTKQSRTWQSLEGENSVSENLYSDLKESINMKIEKVAQIELKCLSEVDIKQKQNLERQKTNHIERLAPQTAEPRLDTALPFPTTQISNINGVMNQGWYSLIGYWPLGAFFFNLQGFY